MGKQEKKKKIGLVLTAGGARGAYQVGVLKRIGELPVYQNQPSPFPIVAGASAGAINGTAVAAGSSDFSATTHFLDEMWASLRNEDVYRTDIRSLTSLTVKMMKDFSLGGMLGGGKAQSLLDASPLKKFLSKHLPFDRIQDAIDREHLYALAITATSYYSGKSFTFIQGQPGHPIWEKSRRVALSAKLSVDHVCASSAIPIVFQPIHVQTPLGDFYFGDGGLRLVTPLSPAIRLGSEKLFAIGIRSQKAAEVRSKEELLMFPTIKPVMKKPPLAQVIGVILNSIFLDHLDADCEHLKRINEIVSHIASSDSVSYAREPVRPLELLVMSPSQDLAKIVENYSSKMSTLVRYFLEGLGTSKSESADLMSYILFDNAYTKDLINLGYKDADDRIDEIEAFLRDHR